MDVLREADAAHVIAIVVPACDEAESIAAVVTRVPPRVAGAETLVVVVDDGSRDGTAAVAEAAGAKVLSHAKNLGQGAALRTGFEFALEQDARLVVTLDADGQHRPEEMERLVAPVLAGEADVVSGSRVLGSADRAALARRLGIAFFNRVLSLATRRRITDCANGYRAISTEALRRLDLRQDRFPNAELLIESAKWRLRAIEVPVTVDRRTRGASRKPHSLAYGLAFALVILRTWLR
jgi:glycosyltransferase involved in cell wall biosynthesis